MKKLSKQAREIEKFVEISYAVSKQDLELAKEHQHRHCGQKDLARAEGAHQAIGDILKYLEGLTYEPVKQ